MGDSQGVVSLMSRIVPIGCLCFLLFSAGLLHLGPGPFPSPGVASAYAQASGTEIMQQSDHHRRVERAKKAETEMEERQVAAFGVPEAASRDYDYLILILLAVSFVVFAFVARRGRRVRSRL